MSEPEDITEAIMKAVFLAKKHAEIARVHVTWEFYARLRACIDIRTIASLVNFEYHLFGYETKVHYEHCDKDYWFEDTAGKEIVFDTSDKKVYTLADYVSEKESVCVANSAHYGPFARTPEGAAMCTQCGEIIK